MYFSLKKIWKHVEALIALPGLNIVLHLLGRFVFSF
jgi:hypothetical protein